MVSKCANPSCVERFLYLHKGKLFRLDTGNAAPNGAAKTGASGKSVRKTQYFWLCEDCARKMTVVFREGVGIMTRPLARAQTMGL